VILVYLEQHGGELEKGGLGVLAKASSLGDTAGVVIGPGASDVATKAGAFGASKVYALEHEAVAAPLPQPRVDALQALVEHTGADAVLFGASVLAADVAAGLAARLDAGLNWDLTDLELRDGELVGKRPALGDTVLVDVGWTGTPRIGMVRAGALDPT
jgi:electron transfer flavoprotein alpha subunit